MTRLLVLLALLVGSGPVLAQDKTKPGDEMITKYLHAEADRLSGKFLDGAKSLEEWKEKLPRLQREYMDMLGLWPIPEKTPLKATITGNVEAHGVVVDKLHYQSMPGLYVAANLYRPKDTKGKKLPAILYVCGHSGKGRDGNKTAFQDHGFWFANNGYLCLIVDTLQLGEIPGVHHGTYGRTTAHFASWGIKVTPEKEPRMWWHSAGYTPAGVECWNGVRGIDYLVSRDDVDPDKIGVTGISGGGAATFWVAAADPRVKVAVPVSGMSDLESYVNNKVVNGHCDCMFLHNTYQWDWTTIAALVAPRPMLFANSDNDGIFPMDGNRRIIAKLRTLYKMYGKPDLVDDYVSVGGHDYRPDLRIAIFKFMNEHLKGDKTTPVGDSAKFTPLPGKDLRAFATDDDLPKDRINDRIDETFVPKAKVKLPEKGKYEEWRKEMVDELKRRVFPSLADPLPTAKLVRSQMDINHFYVAEPHYEFSGGGLESNPRGNGISTVIELSSDNAEDLVQLLKYCEQDSYVYGTSPRGLAYPWTQASPPNFVARSSVLLGRTTDTGSMLDLSSLVKFFASNERGKKLRHRVIGKGKEGIIAAYAALFEPSIKEVVVINPPKSHMQGPHFLNVLRVLDVPEALGLLAPRPLTIIGGKDAAFDRTAEIYRLAGAADKLTRK